MSTHSNQLLGLILAAGNSSRMKVDKAFINYHDIPQYEYAANQLSPYVNKVIINGKEKTNYGSFEIVIDLKEYENNGPISGLLSVTKIFPNQSIFVLGCDYPFLSNDLLRILFDKFIETNKSVCFLNPNGYLEPLVAIYNALDLIKLFDFWYSKQSSLLRFLEMINPLVLPLPVNYELLSIDTPKLQ